MNEEEFEKKHEKLIKTYMKDREYEHNQPSTETLKMFKEQGEQLSALSEAQKFMREDISEIKGVVKDINSKLDGVMTCKADKKEVDLLWKKFDNARTWLMRILIGILIGSLAYFARIAFEHLVK